MNYHLRLKGYVGGWDFDRDYTQYILDKYAGKPVNVCIDSMGGQLDTALSISAAFKDHGQVAVHYVSMNASAATIASLGAKRVSIARDGWYLVHKSSFRIDEYASMNSDQIEDYIKDLEKAKAQLLKYDLQIAKAYARRCKKSPEELYELMKEDRFMSAEEALEWGFVDEITDDPNDPTLSIDNITMEYCRKNNIRLPERLLQCAARPVSITDGHDEESFISRIVASVRSVFRPQPNNPQNTMDKNQEKTTAEEQTQQPASGPAPAMSAEQERQPGLPAGPASDPRDEEVKALKDEIASLRAQLDKRPAAEHSTVIEEQRKPSRNKPTCHVNASSRKLFNSIAGL